MAPVSSTCMRASLESGEPVCSRCRIKSKKVMVGRLRGTKSENIHHQNPNRNGLLSSSEPLSSEYLRISITIRTAKQKQHITIEKTNREMAIRRAAVERTPWDPSTESTVAFLHICVHASRMCRASRTATGCITVR